MKRPILSPESLERALHLRDLTDPRQGPHAMQQISRAIHDALTRRWQCRLLVHRNSPVVSAVDNYDELGYPADGASRDARYTRYITRHLLLRTQTSAMIPGLLRSLALDPPDDILLVCPGLVYRRDSIDRLHTGEPHQLDLWRVARGQLTSDDLEEMIAAVARAALPDHQYRVVPAEHPYTTDGCQIDVRVDGEWIEIGECGLASPTVLERSGLDVSRVTGLAMGLGLDRLLMIRKGIEDIRLLRSSDPRIDRQMLDLEPYRKVSNQPSIRRDLSVAVDRRLTAEELGDHIRETIAPRLDEIEAVEVLSETSYDKLPTAAHERMGMAAHQKNVLLRLEIRHPSRTLNSEEANEIRDLVYSAVHRGNRKEICGQKARAGWWL